MPVTYTVDDKALKGAVSGTPLTFVSYSDTACTTITHTEVINIDNVAVIERRKLFVAKGATKPPRPTSCTPS